MEMKGQARSVGASEGDQEGRAFKKKASQMSQTP